MNEANPMMTALMWAGGLVLMVVLLMTYFKETRQFFMRLIERVIQWLE